MKKLYKKLMKTSVLICLLLLGTGNAWGELAWTGSSTSPGTYSSTYKEIGNTTVYLKGNDKGNNISYDTSVMGFKITYKTYVYLSARNTNGIVTITLQGGSPSLLNNDVTISESTTGFRVVEHVAPKTSYNAGAGTSITFEMKKDLDYSIYSSQQLFIKKVVFNVEGTDYFTLDETVDNSVNKSTISDNTGKTKVLLQRTLKGGQWNTFCCPINFAHTSNLPDVTEVLKCDAVYEMTEYNSEKHEITFTAVKKDDGYYVLHANTPCLIKPTEDIVNPFIVRSSLGGSVKTPTESTLKVTKNGLSFIGVLGAENIYTTGDNTSTKFYLNNDGYLVYPTSDTGNNGKIKGFRAYFEWTGGSSGVKDMTFVFDDSETTGIKTIEHDIFGENGRVYSIDGRYMGDSTDNLSRGIYIQNGRKFVVK